MVFFYLIFKKIKITHKQKFYSNGRQKIDQSASTGLVAATFGMIHAK